MSPQAFDPEMLIKLCAVFEVQSQRCEEMRSTLNTSEACLVFPGSLDGTIAVYESIRVASEVLLVQVHEVRLARAMVHLMPYLDELEAAATRLNREAQAVVARAVHLKGPRRLSATP